MKFCHFPFGETPAHLDYTGAGNETVAWRRCSSGQIIAHKETCLPEQDRGSMLVCYVLMTHPS